jgi:hypothetical protein
MDGRTLWPTKTFIFAGAQATYEFTIAAIEGVTLRAVGISPLGRNPLLSHSSMYECSSEDSSFCACR